MNLRETMRSLIVQRLNRDWHKTLLDDIDEATKADKAPITRGLVYGAAFGVWGNMEGSPIKGDQNIPPMIHQAFNRICDWQREEGDWYNYVGPNYTEAQRPTWPEVWSMFSWLNLYKEFGDHLDPALRAKMEKMFRRAVQWRLIMLHGYLETAKYPVGTNLATAYFTEVWLAGRLLGEPEWESLGREALERIIASQSPAGYWTETTRINCITILYTSHTLSYVALYGYLSGSKTALDAVIRAANYHLAFSHPDGSPLMAFDARNRAYGSSPMQQLVWSLALFKETRGHAAFFARQTLREPLSGGHCPIAAPEVLAWRATPEGDIAEVAHSSGQRLFPALPAVSLSRGSWHLCAHGVTSPDAGGRYHYNTQNHLSAWHAKTGLVLGGGSSLHDPMFSTFRFLDRYLADKGEAEARPDGTLARVWYGAITATAEMEIVNDRTLKITARADGTLPSGSEFAFHLFKPYGKKLVIWGQEQELKDTAFWSGAKEFQIGDVSVRSERNFSVMWPLQPMGIYSPPRRDPLEYGVLRVSADLREGPAEIFIDIAE